MAPRKVLFLHPLGATERAVLAAVSPDVRFEFRDVGTQAYVDSFADPDVEVMVSHYAPSDARRFPRLKWIASVAAGVEEIMATEPWRYGIIVTNGSGLHVTAMGEFVVASMLEVTQQIPDRLAAQREHNWPAWSSTPWVHLAGTRLRGATALIIGYGSVGREVGRLLTAFGMHITAVKARPDTRADSGYRLPGTGDQAGELPERIVGFDALPEVLGQAEFVVIAVPLTTQTRHLVDGPFLAKMRQDAWLINVGRGGHADEVALLAALRARRIAGAALDVFEDEPLPPDSPFWELDNVLITPHFAGAGGPKAFWPDAVDLIAENLRRYIGGRELLNVVDGQKGY
jgi:phosphoglycerate dehydrogenase-like enzyme